ITSAFVQGNVFDGGRGGPGGTGGTVGTFAAQGLTGGGGRGGDGGDLLGGGIYVGRGALTLELSNILNNVAGGTGLARPDGGAGGSAPARRGGNGGDGGDVLGGGVYVGTGAASVTIRNSSIDNNGLNATFPFVGHGGSGGFGQVGQKGIPGLG